MTRPVARSTLPCWAVTVQEHTVGRCEIPGSEEIVYAKDERQARAEAVQRVHVRHEVPGWKPYMRSTWTYTSAARTSGDE